MERDEKTTGVQIKSFHSDDGMFKSAEFGIDLKYNDQIL